MVYVGGVVNINRRAAIPPVVVVRAAVVRMSVIAVVVNVETVRHPADRECGGNTPEIAMVKIMAGCIRVVVDRV